jgi:dipeptidyl aminopeptidase/acylaminoacyl peptidase
MSRLRRASVLAIALFAGCSDSTAPRPLVAPDFVFVSNAGGVLGIHRFDDETVTRLSAADHDDREPHSADGRIVFTSRRDGNAEIYIADLDLSNPQRLTSTTAIDTAPALHPAGTTVAFVSSRSGAPRVWLIDADGANPRALATGSPTFVPEGNPAWSPSGDRIAFTSVRTNTSQVFVVAAAGGDAVQLSHESGGAFGPTWSADGRFVHYMAVAAGPRLVTVPAAGGDARSFAEDPRGLSELTCAATACIATIGALDGDGDLVLFSRDGRSRTPLLERAANDRQPAVLVPRQP